MVKIFSRSLIVAGMMALGSMSARAVEEPAVGSVAAVRGSAEIRRAGGAFTAAREADDLFVRDRIRTGASSRVRLLLRDDTLFTLGSESELELTEQFLGPRGGARSTAVELMRGRVRAVVGGVFPKGSSNVRVQSSTAVAGVRGTEFFFERVSDAIDDVFVVRGTVRVWSRAASEEEGVNVPAGFMTRVQSGRDPTPPREIPLDTLERLESDTARMEPRDLSAELKPGIAAMVGEGFNAAAFGAFFPPFDQEAALMCRP